MKKGKVIGSVIVVGVIAIAGFLIFGSAHRRHIRWETETIGRTSVSNVVTATGTVEPVTKVEVGTQVSGIIDKIYVDYNSVVHKGQLIAEMDKITLQAELESQEAQLANAKAEYDYQQKNYVRNQVLYEKKLISDTDYETSVYNYEKAKSSYEKSQADIIKVRRNLGYAVITSPIDGVVISREVEAGQTVAAGFSTPTLFTIANDLTQMQVIADVDEADIGQVEEGQRVTFIVDAYPNDVFEGKVTQVRLEATVESNVVTYEVVISAPNPELKLKPGLTANITVFTLEKNNILTVSSKALKFIPDEKLAQDSQTGLQPLTGATGGLQKTVWIRNGNRLIERIVRTGEVYGATTEVESGLQEGEEVVVGMTDGKPEGLIPQGTAAERSPFMPQPPGSKKKSYR